MTDLNPHVNQMADESMVRNLSAQIEAIWPQELPLYRRYGLADDIHVLDAGCGTGEASSRLAALYPRAHVLGVDVLDQHLELARDRAAGAGQRVRFEHRSVYELGLPERTFDLVVCRHVLHSIPHADQVIAELVRVTKRGGRLHLIPEDYDMLHFQRTAPDPREFWHEAPARFGQQTGTDLFVGRHAFTTFERLGLEDITLDYIIVDTLRCPRDVFARIIEAWRDGYTAVSAEVMGWPVERVLGYFNRMIANIRDPKAYAVWMVPVLAARVP
jgi:SAM-dependent methyltransferase